MSFLKRVIKNTAKIQSTFIFTKLGDPRSRTNTGVPWHYHKIFGPTSPGNFTLFSVAHLYITILFRFIIIDRHSTSARRSQSSVKQEQLQARLPVLDIHLNSEFVPIILLPNIHFGLCFTSYCVLM